VLSFCSENSGSGNDSEASSSAPLSGCPYVVGFAFLGDGGVGELAVRFLDKRFAALRTWRASLSSEKMGWRREKSDLDMSEALTRVNNDLETRGYAVTCLRV
jgi:hypothetical protein